MNSNNKANEYLGDDLQAMENANNQNKWILSKFRPYLGKCVSEIGAGQGNLTSYLLSENVDSLTAFEPSNEMCAKHRTRFSSEKKVNTINQNLGDVVNDWRATFNSAVYINVLEHIENDQQELQHVHDCLKKDGYLLIYVPALSCLYSSFDKKVGHYRRYHKKGLAKLVEEANFDIVEINYVDMLGIIPWYLAMVLLGKDLNSQGVSIYDKFAIPLSNTIESIFSPPIGKNLLLIAQKKNVDLSV